MENLKYEIWKNIPINGFEHYKISNMGRIISPKKGLLKQTSGEDYRRVHLKSKLNGQQFLFRTHRLVAQTFLENWNWDLEVNHKNLNKLDNRIENLEMVTQKENARHARDNGAFDNDNNNATFNKKKRIKLTPEDVLEIRKLRKIMSQRKLAKKFNVAENTIQKIIKNTIWKQAEQIKVENRNEKWRNLL